MSLLVVLSQNNQGFDIIDKAMFRGNYGETRNLLSVSEMIWCFHKRPNQTIIWLYQPNNIYAVEIKNHTNIDAGYQRMVTLHQTKLSIEES